MSFLEDMGLYIRKRVEMVVCICVFCLSVTKNERKENSGKFCVKIPAIFFTIKHIELHCRSPPELSNLKKFKFERRK